MLNPITRRERERENLALWEKIDQMLLTEPFLSVRVHVRCWTPSMSLVRTSRIGLEITTNVTLSFLTTSFMLKST